MGLIKQNRGVVLPLAAVTVLVLLAIFSLVVRAGYRRMVRSELQVAVDAAAHAGARSLCSSLGCYDAARAEALKNLGIQRIDRGFGRSKNITGLDPSSGPILELPGEYSIKLIRGAWWANGAPNPVQEYGNNFQPLEDENGEALSPSPNYPTLPSFMAANAVYMKVILHNVRDPISLLGGPSQEIEAEAIAIGGDAGATQIAPFAIPVCALIDDTTGDFDWITRCSHDIYFTRRDRYCLDSDPDCGAKPGFFAFPDASADNSFTTGAGDSIPNGSPLGLSEQCKFEDENLSATDIYGFVVKPDNSQTEADLINDSASVLSVHLGDQLQILDSGLTSKDSEKIIRDLAKSSGVTTATWASATGLDSFRTVSRLPGSNSGCAAPESRGWGACNTQRFSYEKDNWVTVDDNSNIWGCQADAVAPALLDEIGNPVEYWPNTGEAAITLPVWNTKAAVVAWDSMGSCKGVMMGSPPTRHLTEPGPPPANTVLQVVGFIDVNIYDTDIGNPPPSPPVEVKKKGHNYWHNENMPVCCDTSKECDPIKPDDSCFGTGGECSPSACLSSCKLGECKGCPSGVEVCKSHCSDSGTPYDTCVDNCVDKEDCANSVTKCEAGCVGEPDEEICRARCSTASSSCVTGCQDSCKFIKVGCEEQCDSCDIGCSACKSTCTKCDADCKDYTECVSDCEKRDLSCSSVTTYQCSPSPAVMPTPLPMEISHAPWGFSPPVAAVEGGDFKCNLVRARTSCSDDFIPSTQNGRGRDTTLVK